MLDKSRICFEIVGTSEIRPGERLLEIDDDVEIGLVVFPGPIVWWFECTDEFGLEQEGFELGITQCVFDRISGYDGGLFGVELRVLGVAAKPRFQIDGFADVEQGIPCPVLIHPARAGCVVKVGDDLPEKS